MQFHTPLCPHYLHLLQGGRAGLEKECRHYISSQRKFHRWQLHLRSQVRSKYSSCCNYPRYLIYWSFVWKNWNKIVVTGTEWKWNCLIWHTRVWNSLMHFWRAWSIGQWSQIYAHSEIFRKNTHGFVGFSAMRWWKEIISIRGSELGKWTEYFYRSSQMQWWGSL